MKNVLAFNALQERQIIGSRRQFNQRAVALAAQGVDQFEGNSLAIPLDAWRRIDARAQVLARSRLVMFSALAAASTTPVSIADVVNYYAQVGDNGDVTVTMDGRNDGKADAADMKYVGTPVPLLSGAVRFGWRQMEVMLKGGGQLDTVSIANEQRKIAEKLEDMVLNGLPSIVVGGDTIYGLRTLPGRNTFAHGLTLATATGVQWVGMVKQAAAAALADNQYGTITLYVNQGDYTAADTTDYAATYAGTILTRLRTIGQIAAIVPSSSVPVNEVIGIVDLGLGAWGTILQAMPLTTMPKTRMDMTDDYVFRCLTAAAPQFRVDYAGNSPFLHGTVA